MKARGRRWALGALAALAVAVGVVHVYPDLQFFADLGPRYAGIHLIAAVDETSYLSRIGRVLQGDYHLGNAMIYEHRADPFTHAPLPEYLLGTIGRVLGLSIVQLDVAATFVLPAVTFLLFVALLRELTGAAALSAVGGLVLSLGPYLVAKGSPLLHGRLFDPAFPHALPLVRPVSPQVQYPLFVLALWALYRVYAGRARVGGVAAAALAWGLTFYTSFYYWTFLAVGLALLAAVAWLAAEDGAARCGLIVLALGVAVGAYYFVNALHVAAAPGADEAMVRAGMMHTRRPIVPLVHTAWLVLFAGWMTRHRDSRAGRFLLVFLVAGFVCLNVQVVTGRTIQPFHWESQTNKIVMVLSAVVVVGEWWRRSDLRRWHPSAWRGAAAAAAVAVTIIVFAHAVLLQRNYYERNRQEFFTLQGLGPALAWLKRATPPDSVVLADPAQPLLSELVSVYGQRFTFLSEPFFTISLVPQGEVDDRYIVAMRVFGLDEDGVQRVLWRTGGSLFLGMLAAPLAGGGGDAVIRRHLTAVDDRYRRIAAGAEPAPGAYRLDYVMVGSDDRSRLRLDLVGGGREVYADGRARVFRVGPVGYNRVQ